MSSRPKKRRRTDYDHNSDSDGQPQQYTGGEMSGMLVQGPSNNNNLDESPDQARHRGAIPLHNLHPSSCSRSFPGTDASFSGETVPNALQHSESVVHNNAFLRNGFTVDDGSQRRLVYHENAQFLESIRKYDYPKEPGSADKRSPVSASSTTREENFPESETHHNRFQGIGRTVRNSSESFPAPDALVAAPVPYVEIMADRSQPSTSIKLWLCDGTFWIAQFNYHHTIADIRSFIDASRPGEGKPYKLQAGGFPHKVLNDNSQTIEQAGLLNSVVIQTF